MSTLDIFKDVPIAELADWMNGHPGESIAVVSVERWSTAWRATIVALSAGARTIVRADGRERVEWPNGAVACVLPLRPWGDAFRGRQFDALCIVDATWGDLTARQSEIIAPSLMERDVDSSRSGL